jgi:parvulin-like peptidyl-prolyl isomerase
VRERNLPLILILMVALLAACGGGPGIPADAASQPPAVDATPTAEILEGAPLVVAQAPSPDPSQAAPPPDGVVALVNGQPITQAELDREMGLRPSNPGLSLEANQGRVLETLIEMEVIRQVAPSFGVAVTDEALQAELDSLKASTGDEASWQAWLATNGLTEDDLREAQRDLLITSGIVALLGRNLEGDVAQIRARHILLATQEEALAVIERMRLGESFDALASLSLDSTTRDAGGDLGWFTREELWDQTLADVAFSLEVGATAGPIQSAMGFHIVQILEAGERPVEPERLPVIMENMFLNWLDEQKATFDIQRFIGG